MQTLSLPSFAARTASILQNSTSRVRQPALLYYQKPISPFYMQSPHRRFTPTCQRLSTNPKPNTTERPTPTNPSFGEANFKELGASRTVKVVVIVALSIVGTIETMFWVKLLWAKFVGPGEQGGKEAE